MVSDSPGQATGESWRTVSRIVVGVDGSEGSRRALAWAIGEATARRARLEAVMVWSYPHGSAMGLSSAIDTEKLAEGTRYSLAKAVAQVAGPSPTVRIEPVVLEGDPSQVLCRLSGEADLLVIGSRGRGGFAGLLMGSVSTKCAHHSSCPVVIVPEAHRPDAGT